MGKTAKDDNLKPKPLPRGHAYMRFRNRGYTLHVDFEKTDVSWLEGVIKAAFAEMNKQDSKGAVRG